MLTELFQLKENPDQAPNIYQRYVNAAQKQFMQGKKKTQEVAQDKKVNVAMTKNDSIFPNIHLPGGISSKATEYRNQAMQGSEWRSPIFKVRTPMLNLCHCSSHSNSCLLKDTNF